jgi:hypothetical protein
MAVSLPGSVPHSQCMIPILDNFRYLVVVLSFSGRERVPQVPQPSSCRWSDGERITIVGHTRFNVP